MVTKCYKYIPIQVKLSPRAPWRLRRVSEEGALRRGSIGKVLIGSQPLMVVWISGDYGGMENIRKNTSTNTIVKLYSERRLGGYFQISLGTFTASIVRVMTISAVSTANHRKSANAV